MFICTFKNKSWWILLSLSHSLTLMFLILFLGSLTSGHFSSMVPVKVLPSEIQLCFKTLFLKINLTKIHSVFTIIFSLYHLTRVFFFFNLWDCSYLDKNHLCFLSDFCFYISNSPINDISLTSLPSVLLFSNAVLFSF